MRAGRAQAAFAIVASTAPSGESQAHQSEGEGGPKLTMALIVAKFGGTSVASPERIKNVAKRLAAMRQRGDQVVAVVSAMGKTTDELLGLTNAITSAPPARELDRLLSTGEHVSMALLAMALDALGLPSMSFTGRQAGIQTDDLHNRAKITGINTERILEALDEGVVPVVAGFQGIDANGDITTLGRGGSDTTAVAIAWGINADVCEIYSDVDGVYTTDPRVAPRAHKLAEVSYDDMLELSSAGSGVLQSRAVEFARTWGVVIHARSAFSDAIGTYIKEDSAMEKAVITGIAHDTSEVKVTLRGVPDSAGVAARVFSALAEAMVNLDMIIQNVGDGGVTDISFTCPGADLPRATAAMDAILPEVGHLHEPHPPVGGGGRGPGHGGGAVPAHRLRAGLGQRVQGDAAVCRGDSRQDGQGALSAPSGPRGACEGPTTACARARRRLDRDRSGKRPGRATCDHPRLLGGLPCNLRAVRRDR